MRAGCIFLQRSRFTLPMIFFLFLPHRHIDASYAKEITLLGFTLDSALGRQIDGLSAISYGKGIVDDLFSMMKVFEAGYRFREEAAVVRGDIQLYIFMFGAYVGGEINIPVSAPTGMEAGLRLGIIYANIILQERILWFIRFGGTLFPFSEHQNEYSPALSVGWRF